MVGALLAVAQGKANQRDIKLMLQVPSQRSWIEKIKSAPAHGLYLCEVKYLDKDRSTFRESLEGAELQKW